MQSRKLGEIASIQSGYSFRAGVNNEENGSVSVVQAKDVKGLYVDESALPLVTQTFDKDRLLQAGDIVLSSRGSFRAAVCKAESSMVASSSLLIIRLESASNLLPEFASAYLNSAQAQAYLNQNAKGATIQSIRIDDMQHMIIPLITLGRQQLVVDLQRNTESQGKLLESKSGIIEEIFKGSINQAIKGVTG